MRMQSSRALALGIAVLLGFQTTEVSAQSKSPDASVVFGERNLGGPRLGFTYVPGNGKLAQSLRSKQIGTLLSQFGWQFEYQVIPNEQGASFVIQFLPLIAGVEHGTLIPSGTLTFGVRLQNGIEFGLGPGLMVNAGRVANTELNLSIGKSFNYGGVSIPLNLMFATSPDGGRFAIIFGYAIS